MSNFNIGNSLNADLKKSMPAKEVKSYLEPPIRLMESMGYKNKPSALTYNTLYQMSVKNSVVGAIINTRINQVSNFTSPARYNTDKLGFEIRLRDPNVAPTKEQQDVILSIEDFIEKCGFQYDAHRDSFDTFVRKLVRDSLTYDQATFEIIPDASGRPAEFIAVDASTIRVATEELTKHSFNSKVDPPKEGEEIGYVQVIDGAIVSWFTPMEMAFGVRNPRTNIYMTPYGFSELEQLITQITSHLYAEEYNSKFFSQGGTTKGIINIKQDPNGIMNQEMLESFKRQWRAQVTGLAGAWKTPVLQVPNGVEYINVSQSNREMEFEKWMNYLINIACAVFQIDPAEVNFPNNGGVGGSNSVFESGTENRVKNSKDKGLRPLLRFIEDLMNKYIIRRFSKEYVFKFVGMDDKTESEEAEIDTKQVKAYKTINEVRAKHGLKPLDDGDVILDASFMNMVNQKQMQAQMGAMGGDEDDDGWDDEDEDNDSWDDEDTSDDEDDTQDDEDTPDEDVNKSLSELIISLEE